MVLADHSGQGFANQITPVVSVVPDGDFSTPMVDVPILSPVARRLPHCDARLSWSVSPHVLARSVSFDGTDQFSFRHDV